MALNIKWSKEAKDTFEDILAYLNEEWSSKEVENFITRTESILEIIAKQPYLYKASFYKEIRQAVIGKQNSLSYKK